MRATLNDAGLPQASASYDAWGVPETPLLGSFGFTGELQRGSDVWLRARWYGAGRRARPQAGGVEGAKPSTAIALSPPPPSASSPSTAQAPGHAMLSMRSGACAVVGGAARWR